MIKPEIGDSQAFATPPPVRSAYLAITQIPITFTNRKTSPDCHSSVSLSRNDLNAGCVRAIKTVKIKPLTILAIKGVRRAFPVTTRPLNITATK